MAVQGNVTDVYCSHRKALKKKNCLHVCFRFYFNIAWKKNASLCNGMCSSVVSTILLRVYSWQKSLKSFFLADSVSDTTNLVITPTDYYIFTGVSVTLIDFNLAETSKFVLFSFSFHPIKVKLSMFVRCVNKTLRKKSKALSDPSLFVRELTDAE